MSLEEATLGCVIGKSIFCIKKYETSNRMKNNARSFFNVLKEVSSAHQGCIYIGITVNNSNVVMKYYY